MGLYRFVWNYSCLCGLCCRVIMFICCCLCQMGFSCEKLFYVDIICYVVVVLCCAVEIGKLMNRRKNLEKKNKNFQKPRGEACAVRHRQEKSDDRQEALCRIAHVERKGVPIGTLDEGHSEKSCLIISFGNWISILV